jgi:hypothetical protein
VAHLTGFRRALRLLGSISLLVAAPALAHDETVSTSDVVVSGDEVLWRVDVGVAGVAKALHLPSAAPGEPELMAARERIAAYLAGALTVTLNDDGRPAAAEIGALDPRYEAGTAGPARVVLALRYRAARPVQRVRFRVAFFAELTRQHRSVVTVRWGGGVRQVVRLGVAEVELGAGDFAPARMSVAREFLAWGTEHIFLGYDHIAFLLALLLVARGWAELLKIVTSFTVAHSLTLLLSALDVVRVPSRLTEVLIAASIVYVAAENLYLYRQGGAARGRPRWPLTFAFGLVHGLGFATELRQRLASLPGSVLLPVVSFNLGVELGQLAIVAAAFPLLRAARGAEATGLRVVRWGSAAILVLGLGWLVERLVS